MDQIHLMNVFVMVGEGASFAAAARRLDLTPADRAETRRRLASVTAAR